MASHGPYESIGVDVVDGVATVEIQRPEKHNAMNDDVMFDLQRAFGELEVDRSIDAVVVTGEGEKAFSSGGDIQQYAGSFEEKGDEQEARQKLNYEVFSKAHDLHAPVISKINGYCVGGGLLLAIYSDLRVAVDDAKFGLPVCKIGQLPGGGASYRAVQLIGEAKVKELTFTADLIDAKEACRIGLVNRVVERNQLDEEVDELVESIQSVGRQAVKRSKDLLNYSAQASDSDTATEYEREMWLTQYATDERVERIDEFLEE